MHRPARTLDVERIREVLAAWPPPPADATGDHPTEPDLELVADFHRIVDIHQRAGQGGVDVARASLQAQLESETPAEELVDVLPAGDALTTRRMATVREGRHEATRAAVARLAAVEPGEEAAVRACREEIEAALGRRR